VLLLLRTSGLSQLTIGKMMLRLRYHGVLLATLFLGAAFLLATAHFIGWNSSASAAPIGFYLRSAPHPKRGQLVEVCLPPEWADFAMARGYIRRSWRCPDGSEALGKIVIGMPGDTLWIDPATVQAHDSLGRPLPHNSRFQHLGAGQIWVYGSAAKSFDSRYFGAVPMANVIANLTPIWTWGKQ
jgi:conjugative transfer signal peptidase TraF